jgi:hypothetical protein
VGWTTEEMVFNFWWGCTFISILCYIPEVYPQITDSIAFSEVLLISVCLKCNITAFLKVGRLSVNLTIDHLRMDFLEQWALLVCDVKVINSPTNNTLMKVACYSLIQEVIQVCLYGESQMKSVHQSTAQLV